MRCVLPRRELARQFLDPIGGLTGKLLLIRGVAAEGTQALD